MVQDGPAASRRRSGSHRRIAVFIVVAVVALLFVWALGDIFAPVFAALALAYMLNPFVKRLEARGWSRRRAVLAIFTATIFLIVSMIAASIPFIVRDVSYAVLAAKTRLDQAGADEEEDASGTKKEEVASKAVEKAENEEAATGEGGADEDEDASEVAEEAESNRDAAYHSELGRKLERALRRSETMRMALDWAEKQRLTERTFAWLQENARLVAEQTLSAAKGGMAILFRIGWLGFMVLLFPVYLYFFMVGLGEVTGKAFTVVPPTLRPKVEKMAHEFGVSLSAFFRGRLVVALAIGLFTATGFALVGLRFGVFLGIAIGIASMVPFVNIIFLVPALIIAPVQFESFWWMAIVFGIYALGQGLDPLLTPYLLSRGTGLHPVTIIVSLLVWGRLLGAVGLLMAVPLTAAAKIAGRELLLPALTGGGEGPSEPDATPAPGNVASVPPAEVGA